MEATSRSRFRTPEREVASICRKVARKVVKDGTDEKIEVVARDIPRYLGVPKYSLGKKETEDSIGLVNGLAVLIEYLYILYLLSLLLVFLFLPVHKHFYLNNDSLKDILQVIIFLNHKFNWSRLKCQNFEFFTSWSLFTYGFYTV